MEIDEFETSDPALRGEMTITITLTDANSGTKITAAHENVPKAIPNPTTNKSGKWYWGG